MSDKDFLILVHENDKPWGKLEKDLVHQLGLLHRAFSVFIFNTKGEMLLQQRADDKYHSGGLWTNTCCSHPRWGEEIGDAVERRLEEEMGLKCETDFSFTFQYKTHFENGLTEHELDHVYTGVSDDIPLINKEEVKSWKYFSVEEIRKDLLMNPDHYTAWFKLVFERVIASQRKALVA
jgi:isopentenyl-diphosphate delta-isomerase